MNLESIRSHLFAGQAIPAMPLALNEDASWSQQHQRALVRYYLDAGVGGIAVGVHSTQFEIRDPEHALFGPVLKLCSEEIDSWLGENASPLLKIAGICGKTQQALQESELALKNGYHAGLLSMTAMSDSSQDELLAHCEDISQKIPIIGFYLQPSVGGHILPFDFWKRFAEIENVVAIKIAPFNRYATNDVVRAVIESGREDIALYTGNDDSIITDLLTEFEFNSKKQRIVGGLLGQWGVWAKRAVELLEEIKSTAEFDQTWLTKNAQLTDANGVIFDAVNSFHGCIPGILEVLRRQGVVPSNRCLNPNEKLSPGQFEELNRIQNSYPDLIDDDFVSENLERWLNE
ncbi:dihydrodipicolinate synthase family protein [Verrucomicrobiales bacterium]|nr:dihydrodipicolinate synthase family protein [Verrucomicrobiales bacterium]